MRPLRIVFDTHTMAAALLCRGPARRLLLAVAAGDLQLYTSPDLLRELGALLQRPRLAGRQAAAGVAPSDLVLGMVAHATLVAPAPMDPVIWADPPDNRVLACALAARAHAVVSGDGHLLDVVSHAGIPIMRPGLLAAVLDGVT